MKCDADMKSNRSLMYSDFFIGELVGNWLIFVMVDLLTVMSEKGNEQTMCWTNMNQQIIEFQNLIENNLHDRKSFESSFENTELSFLEKSNSNKFSFKRITHAIIWCTHDHLISTFSSDPVATEIIL